jgi:tRNA 5-methylaminomethyl-2-thiouridine biosynthesis bifunctional protein
MVLKSAHYDDVYFSAQDGLAESRHVFLDGNNLPSAWQGKSAFIIAETGFGTGLNFLAVWKLFLETAAPDQSLYFISYEKHPLESGQIREALQNWQDDIGQQLEAMLVHYKPETIRINPHPQITLDLRIGDINDELPKQSEVVDCWFLDGFRPATNPDMWSEIVMSNIGRCTQAGGSFATFTVAGFVRRGLKEAGFDVRKVKGFGTKREMLVGAKR